MASQSHYQLFETASGVAAIGWQGTSITGLRLPAPTAAETEHAMVRRLPRAMRAKPSAEIEAVIGAAIRYFAGERVEFFGVPIDLGKQSPFFAQVYDRVRTLGWGETTTYGAIAQELGAGPETARAVGQAMATNPIPLIVPCHRVMAAGGKIGGFSAPGGALSKAHMLELEGVTALAASPAPAQQGFDF